MIDKKSKAMLKYISSKERNPGGFMLFSDFYDAYTEHSGLSEQEVMACMRFLESRGYIKYFKSQSGRNVGFEIEHVARNQTAFKVIGFKRYVLNNWIAILSLVIAAIALMRTF